MSEQNLFEIYEAMVSAIQLCINQNLVIPALVLIYAFIDSVSWLDDSKEDGNVGERFQKWANNYMLQAKDLNCTAEELYAARCGVLHTLTPESILGKKKGVRKIGYAYGKIGFESLEKASKICSDKNCVLIDLEDLFESFKLGLANYLEQMRKNEKTMGRFRDKAKKHFAYLGISAMNNLLEEKQKEEEVQKLTNEK